MNNYRHEYKNIVEGTQEYRKILNIVGKCMKQGGIVEFDQTHSTRRKVRVQRMGKRITVEETRGIFSVKFWWPQ